MGIWVGILLICLLLRVLVPGGAVWLKEFLIPGDSVVTLRALDTLQENVRAGEELPLALAAFCREILDGGEVPD